MAAVTATASFNNMPIYIYYDRDMMKRSNAVDHSIMKGCLCTWFKVLVLFDTFRSIMQPDADLCAFSFFDTDIPGMTVTYSHQPMQSNRYQIRQNPTHGKRLCARWGG